MPFCRRETAPAVSLHLHPQEIVRRRSATLTDVIAHLRGQIFAKAPNAVILDCGGVGYELEAPMSTFLNLPAVGETVHLITHLVVREDAHILYGFATEEERRLFRNLLKVSGVGAKIALGVL